ncbi:hypothetical protein [Herbaspirillum camelliae]|uniref:hypothetical protein n=1 Tax=Herbaspirillum camelliae TaxID=1892903 RepID=UPI00117ABE45|nr:hypothetical protein [Herbaspirillum camelliae]
MKAPAILHVQRKTAYLETAVKGTSTLAPSMAGSQDNSFIWRALGFEHPFNNYVFRRNGLRYFNPFTNEHLVY